jgi:cell division protein FtsL
MAWQVLLLAALALAAAGLVWERRAGRWQISRAAFVLLLMALLLGAVGVLVALVGQ